MGKLLKYELKSMYKFILMVLLTIVLSSTILQINVFRISQANFSGMENEVPGFGLFLMILAGVVIWAVFLVSFFYIVNSFNKELLDDRGYLTFTLPLTGRQILGAKVLSSLIAFIVLSLGAFLFNLILGTILINKAGINIFQELISIELPKGIFKILTVLTIYGLISTIVTLITIYFVMTLRKVVFGGRKLNGMWFIFYLVISGLIGYAGIKIMEFVPYSLMINESGKFYIENLYNYAATGFDSFIPIMNIGNMVFNIVIGVVLFFITSYMLDKKVEI